MHLSDLALLNGIVALKIFGYFDFDKLASINYQNKDDQDIRMMQNLLLYAGFNFYGTVPYKMVGYVNHLNLHYGGQMPTQPANLIRIYHVKRKIASLLLQDGIDDDTRDRPMHLVVDRHLRIVIALKHDWVKNPLDAQGKLQSADYLAQCVESWLPPNRALLREINEVYCGIRQHWKDKTIDEKGFMEAVAKVKTDTGKTVDYSIIVDKEGRYNKYN